MLVSLKNIAQYVSLDGLTPEDIANKLTFAGIALRFVSFQIGKKTTQNIRKLCT